MTITELNNKITFYTSLDTNTFSTTDRLVSINNWYDKLHSIILESQAEWDFDDSNATDLPIAKTDLLASTKSYALPETLYRLNKLEVNYGSGFIKAQPIDLNETGLSEDEISARATVNNPYYRTFGRTFTIYPTPTAEVTGGLQLYFDREVDDFSASDLSTGTKKPGLDRLWHDFIALGASLDAGIKFNLVNKGDLKNMLDDMEARIRKYYGRRQVDRQINFRNTIENYE